MNRGVDRQDIFWRDGDRHRFLDVFGERSERHGIIVYAYALMSNHYHAIVDIAGGDLPGMMREFQSVYSHYVNHRTGRSGPLVERRYTSIPVEDDAQFVQVVRYVHRNPIGITGSTHLLDWPWSSLATVVGHGRGPGWLRTDELERRMETAGHLENVLTPQPADRLPYAWIPPLRQTHVEEVLAAVGEVCGDEPACARHQIIALLSARYRAIAPDELAIRLGLSPKTVRNHASVARARLADEPAFAATIDEVVQELG